MGLAKKGSELIDFGGVEIGPKLVETAPNIRNPRRLTELLELAPNSVETAQHQPKSREIPRKRPRISQHRPKLLDIAEMDEFRANFGR